MLFDKYVDFIDTYAEVDEKEREDLYREISEKKETTMLAQYIKDKGIQQGIQKGIQQGHTALLIKQLTKKFNISADQIAPQLEGLPPNDLLELGEYILDIDSFEDIKRWIKQKRNTLGKNWQ